MKLLALLSTAAALSTQQSTPAKLDRRHALQWGGAALATTLANPAVAAAPATVFVAGATGQTGRRVLERLAAKGGSVVAGGARDLLRMVPSAWAEDGCRTPAMNLWREDQLL